MAESDSISPSRVTVAGIGASAGGIDALRHFFAAVPPDLGLAYVVVVHLAPHLKMPEMDGYEVAQRVRSEPRGGDAWLVALTGSGLDEHKRRTKDAGFDQHLTKPADRAALESILARNHGEQV